MDELYLTSRPFGFHLNCTNRSSDGLKTKILSVDHRLIHIVRRRMTTTKRTVMCYVFKLLLQLFYIRFKELSLDGQYDVRKKYNYSIYCFFYTERSFAGCLLSYDFLRKPFGKWKVLLWMRMVRTVYIVVKQVHLTVNRTATTRVKLKL